MPEVAGGPDYLEPVTSRSSVARQRPSRRSCPILTVTRSGAPGSDGRVIAIAVPISTVFPLVLPERTSGCQSATQLISLHKNRRSRR